MNYTPVDIDALKKKFAIQEGQKKNVSASGQNNLSMVDKILIVIIIITVIVLGILLFALYQQFVNA